MVPMTFGAGILCTLTSPDRVGNPIPKYLLAIGFYIATI